ncbi:hypothetical protein B0T24DRAFT_341607 [Lasiosphaeria ovina]|uniref:AAA+ ATPase lid domain-containing protein n=1 Tax=Lasiosphaeria ovina TaxID=92902 RepID=A0AAE0K2B7_9PEZI|nr:hypothetical protein B0T24DRAFT_341607 [Lasiosphaeria ovina]
MGQRWNGREIRNAFQSALALAEFGLEPGATTTLTPDHFKPIYQASSAFQKYRTDTRNLRPGNADLTAAPDKAAGQRLEDPDARHERIPGGTDRYFNPSPDTGEDTDPDDRYPRLPPWERRPLAQTSTHPAHPGASSASRHQQFPSGFQQQQWPSAGMMYGGPMPFPPMMSYLNGVFGMQPFPQPQAMTQPGPSGMYPNTLNSLPWAPPQPTRVEPAQAAQSLRPGYGPQLVPDPAQLSKFASEPFDWFGERIKSLASQFGTPGRPVPGYLPGYSPAYFHAEGGSEVGRERKRKRRGAGDGGSSS